MKKSELKQRLSRIRRFKNPKSSLEQYATPADLASELLNTAKLRGDIKGRKIADLGAGTGRLGYGAFLLGAEVHLVEKDERLEKYLSKLSGSNEFHVEICDVENFSLEVDTVVSNPPFGVHSDEWEKFVDTGSQISNSAYWIVLDSRESKFKSRISFTSHSIIDQGSFEINLPPTFGFHTEDNKSVDVKVFITED